MPKYTEDKLRKKIRKSTGQSKPFTRPEDENSMKDTKKGGLYETSKNEMDEINEARKKYFRSKLKKK